MTQFTLKSIAGLLRRRRNRFEPLANLTLRYLDISLSTMQTLQGCSANQAAICVARLRC